MGGGQKLLADFRGKPVIQHTLEALKPFVFCETLIVTGYLSKSLTACVRRVKECDPIFCHNADWHHGGLSSSIRVGIRARKDHTGHGLMMVLADLPRLQSETILKVGSAFLRHPECAVRPWCCQKPGHPVVVPEAWMNDFLGLKGDRGGRDLFVKRKSEVIDLKVEDTGIHRDIDTPVDLNS